MGGLSSSTVSWETEGMVFEGIVSLENGGGFASLLSPSLDAAGWQPATSAGLALDLVGDGKTYVLQFRTDNQLVGWVQRFPTQVGVQETVVLPWSSFKPVDRFLNPIASDATLDPASATRLAIYILDKQDGPFRLLVRSII